MSVSEPGGGMTYHHQTSSLPAQGSQPKAQTDHPGGIQPPAPSPHLNGFHQITTLGTGQATDVSRKTAPIDASGRMLLTIPTELSSTKQHRYSPTASQEERAKGGSSMGHGNGSRSMRSSGSRSPLPRGDSPGSVGTIEEAGTMPHSSTTLDENQRQLLEALSSKVALLERKLTSGSEPVIRSTAAARPGFAQPAGVGYGSKADRYGKGDIKGRVGHEQQPKPAWGRAVRPKTMVGSLNAPSAARAGHFKGHPLPLAQARQGTNDSWEDELELRLKQDLMQLDAALKRKDI